jgi:hypothetical protein
MAVTAFRAAEVGTYTAIHTTAYVVGEFGITLDTLPMSAKACGVIRQA